MQREFNLIDEPWIKVLNANCEVEEVSLNTLFEKAHQYKCLAGEMPAQDNAILRLLIAVLYSVFARVDINGEEDEIEEKEDALERWQSIWELKQFPIKPIQNYLDQYHDRFYLIDDKRPFYQVADLNDKVKQVAAHKDKAKDLTLYQISRLMLNFLESNNKVRISLGRGGEGKEALEYAEAARWLICLNAYDARVKETTAHKKYRKANNIPDEPKPNFGWAGKLGNLEAVGKNLFQSLLLNLTLLQDGSENWEPIQKDCQHCATWELDTPRSEERCLINIPKNPAALLTLQSRRVILEVRDHKVIGYRVVFGDFFESADYAFEEQMTIWKSEEEKPKKGSSKDEKETIIRPKKYGKSKQSWQEFSSLYFDTARTPGIVNWIHRLIHEDILTEKNVHFKNIAVYYDEKGYSIIDTYYDELSFNGELLDNAGKKWRQWITDEIKMCELCAYEIGKLEKTIMLASGGSESDKKNKTSVNKMLFFNRINLPVRKWIAELDPNRHDKEYVNELRQIVRDEALQVGKEMIEQVKDTKALFGRIVSVKEDNKTVSVTHSALDGYDRFKRNIRYKTKEVSNE